MAHQWKSTKRFTKRCTGEHHVSHLDLVKAERQVSRTTWTLYAVFAVGTLSLCWLAWLLFTINKGA